MRIPRSRGAVSGLLLIVLGAWGALVPFVGPYFGLAYGTDDTWDWSTDRLWLSVVPGVVVVIGGLILLQSAHRGGAGFGAWLGVAAGAWFVVGGTVSRLWTSDGGSALGAPLGDTNRQVLEQLTMYEGLGVLVAAVAAFALGRLAVRSVKDVELAEAEARPPAAPARADNRARREPSPAGGAVPVARRPWAGDEDEGPTTRQPVADDEARTTRQPAVADAGTTPQPVADDAATTRQPTADDARPTRPVGAVAADAPTTRSATDEAAMTRPPVASTRDRSIEPSPTNTAGSPIATTRDDDATRPIPPATAPARRSGGLMGRLRGR